MSLIKIDFDQVAAANLFLKQTLSELDETIRELNLLQQNISMDIQKRYDIADRLSSALSQLQDMQERGRRLKSLTDHGAQQYQILERRLSKEVSDIE